MLLQRPWSFFFCFPFDRKVYIAALSSSFPSFLSSFGWAKSIKQHNRIIDPVCVCAVYLHFSVCPAPRILLKVILRDGDVIAKPTDADQSSDGRRGVCVSVWGKKHTHPPRKMQLTNKKEENHRHSLDDDDDDDDQEERWK